MSRLTDSGSGQEGHRTSKVETANPTILTADSVLASLSVRLGAAPFLAACATMKTAQTGQSKTGWLLFVSSHVKT